MKLVCGVGFSLKMIGIRSLRVHFLQSRIFCQYFFQFMDKHDFEVFTLMKVETLSFIGCIMF